MRRHIKTNRAFTLIELLTVIAIIGILAGLLFPAIKNSLLKGEAAKAQAGIASLQTAFRSYYTEYGKWPISDNATPPPNHTYIIDANFVALLQGVNKTPPPTPLGLAEPPFSGAGAPVGGAKFEGNPRGIHFVEFKQTDFDGAGNFVDPWKVPYKCRFDVSYANVVDSPFAPASPSASAVIVTNGFVIWSSGPDGQYDNTGDSPPSALNKDNVKSW